MKKFIVVTLVLIAIGAIGVGIPTVMTIADGIRMGAFSKVQDSKPPLTVAQVEAVMGRPAHIDASETTGLTGAVYYYPYHDRDMKVVFVNGLVFKAEFVPGGKSS